MHVLACRWMGEPYLCSMEHQSFAFGAIELVANDGTPQAVRMSTMNAQLVSAPCLRIKGDKGAHPLPLPEGKAHPLPLPEGGVIGKEFVVGDGAFAMFHIDHLPRTIHRIWS